MKDFILLLRNSTEEKCFDLKVLGNKKVFKIIEYVLIGDWKGKSVLFFRDFGMK